jgi:hypothetical protein
MGIQTGPSAYSRGISEMCKGLYGTKAYIDDISVSNGKKVMPGENINEELEDWDRGIRQGRIDEPANEWELHYLRVKKFLMRCGQWQLRLNPKKCKIGAAKMEFLGYVISGEGFFF